MKALEIIGGGLAGLALGTALRQRGISVTVHEAGDYPRHRVCGEFIAGLDPATQRNLQLDPVLEGALPHRRIGWYQHGRFVRGQNLPAPAWGLSRHTLDRRLAERFLAAGGDLRTRSRRPLTTGPGRVIAAGRNPARTDWLGLKLHCRNFPLSHDLEVHLGTHGYIGVSRVEDGRVNICALVRRRRGLRPASADVLPAYAEACGLDQLAARIRRAGAVPGSTAAVAGFAFKQPPPGPGEIKLGDAFAMMPPFTGDGMATAFQTAALALDPLTAWSAGQCSWPEACGAVSSSLRACLQPRFLASRMLHPFFYNPGNQRWLVGLSRTGMLPATFLFRLLH